MAMDDTGGSDEIRCPGGDHVDGDPGHVGQICPGRLKGGTQVDHHLFRLPGDVPDRDCGPREVQRAGPCGRDQPR